MKLSKRSIVLILCMVTAMALSVAGTLAYLTDTAEVTNTFTVGKVQISLDEAVVTADGVPVTDPATGSVTRTEVGNNYHLVPGLEFTKDPTLTVKAESEVSHVRMVVTITKYPELEAAFTSHGQVFKAGDYAIGYDAAKWIAQQPAVDADGNLVLEYRYYNTVSTMGTGDMRLEPLFTSFVVPGILNNDDMQKLLGMEIKVRGEAMQAAGFHKQDGTYDADAAWAAFESAQGTVKVQTLPAVVPQPEPQPEVQTEPQP